MSLTLARKNVWRVIVNRVLKVTRHYEQRGRKALKIVSRQAESLFTLRPAVSDAVAGARRWVLRTKKQRGRWNELVLVPYREQQAVERELAAICRGDGPIMVGPWLSEVGFEILYWGPFLRWVKDRYRLTSDRLIVVSRGGVASWYADVADRYVEVFDLIACEEYARRNQARRERGDQKQLAISAFDEEMIGLACRRLHIEEAAVCHPSLMYRLFRRFWLGTLPLDSVLTHTHYALQHATAPNRLSLPDDYVAVKFYTGPALPDTAENREALRALVARLARSTNVVLLDTGLWLDDHADYPFREIPRVISVREHLTPQTNLAVQTQVIAGARAFIGTCGSLAWLAPMLGVDTVAVFADDRFLAPHLYLARHAYRAMHAARFASLDLTALDQLELPGAGRVAQAQVESASR